MLHYPVLDTLFKKTDLQTLHWTILLAVIVYTYVVWISYHVYFKKDSVFNYATIFLFLGELREKESFFPSCRSRKENGAGPACAPPSPKANACT